MPLHSRAYAKINLGLFVVRRRGDGYHDIETVFHRIDLFDRLTFEVRDNVELRTSSDAIPADERNLCYRAATLLREQFGVRKGAAIVLEKNIPVGAGLGGGSSDAAATLLALAKLWELPIDERAMAALALRLGSDVPYFLKEGSAEAGGRGEILEYFPLALPSTILVVNPGIHVSTQWAYSQIEVRNEGPTHHLKEALLANRHSTSRLITSIRNDFEEPVFREFPAVGALKHDLFDAGASFALMSGSGSTVYGLFDKAESAQVLAERFRQRGFTVSITPPLFSPPHQCEDEP